MREQTTGAAQLSASRPPLGGIYATVGIMLFMGLGFIILARPPTTVHLAAAAVLGGSALALLIGALLLTPTRSHWGWLALGQLGATGLFIAVLFSQQVERSPAWWVIGAAMTLGPVAYTALRWVRSTHG